MTKGLGLGLRSSDGLIKLEQKTLGSGLGI